MTIKLYDLVARAGVSAPFFSPATTRARLGLVHKGIDFKTVEVTYHDLRFGGWKEKLGVEKATAPFIELDDGTLIMDSVAICRWLDKTYPDNPCIFLPEAALPVDVTSAPYLAAADEFDTWTKNLKFREVLFAVYAPLIVPTFDDETKAYWTAKERLGNGVWERLQRKDQREAIDDLKQAIKHFESQIPEGQLYLTSATAPGIKDFSLFGAYRMLRAVSAPIAAETFEQGGIGEILARLHEFYIEGLVEVHSRDPK